MKVTREEIADRESLLGHLVLEALSQYPSILDPVSARGECKVQLLIDGKEVNIRPFIDHWQSQKVMGEKRAADPEAHTAASKSIGW